ncbi:MAG: TraB/GumN family protein [Defluviitaleaceae bacterium]|nr:TraB/GumN family protein [Defluviitaleaceae bacterium]
MKKSKVLTMAVLIFALLLGSVYSAYAAPEGMLPVRATFEEAAGVVSWDDEQRVVYIVLEDSFIVFFADGEQAIVNGQPVELQDGITIYQDMSFITMDDLLTALSVVAEQAAPSHVHPEETPRGGVITGALHRIEYGDNVVYLFGSLHGEREGWFPLAYEVEAAMRRSDVFAFETDFTDFAAMVEAVGRAAWLPDDLTLDDILTPEEVETYINALRTFGITDENLGDIQRENPVFVSLMFSQMLMLELADDIEAGLTQNVDSYVLSFAQQFDLPLIFLEPVEQQVTILYLPPVDVIAHVARTMPTMDELLEGFAEADEIGFSLDDMATAYETNDLYLLSDMLAPLLVYAQEDIFIAYQRDILYNFRSTYYAEGILSLLQETEQPTTFFVTVGISHIMRSWAGEGFTDIVEQLKLSDITSLIITPLF